MRPRAPPILWVIIEGDPADSNPRTNVRLEPNLQANFRADRICVRNMTVCHKGFALTGYSARGVWFDNVEFRGTKAQEQNTKPITLAVGTAVWFTACRYWKLGSAMRRAGTQRPMLIRGCEAARGMQALTILTSRWIASLDDTVSYTDKGSSLGCATAGWGDEASTCEDHIVFG